MKLETFKYDIRNNWSVKRFPKLDSENTLLILFAAPEYRDIIEPLTALREAYPKSTIIGCSSADEIFDKNIFDKSLLVAVMKFNTAQINLAVAKVNDANDSYLSGKQIADKLNKDKLRCVLTFSDGLMVNGSALVEGITKNLPKDVIVTGGLAGDDASFTNTWVIVDDKPQSAYVAAVGLYGDDLQVSYGSKGGWDIFGPERKITRSEGNVLYEIDGLPALALYKKYLGHRADELPSAALLFPLAIRENYKSENQIVRTVLAVDEKSQSMTFAGDIHEGWCAQLMKANFDRLVDGAYGAASMAATNKSDNAVLAIAISCVGRRLVLGERSEEETEATMEGFSNNVKQIGFYSYGEIAPDHFGKCDLHNQTMTITTITER